MIIKNIYQIKTTFNKVNIKMIEVLQLILVILRKWGGYVYDKKIISNGIKYYINNM